MFLTVEQAAADMGWTVDAVKAWLNPPPAARR
jgi:hypothetical protein